MATHKMTRREILGAAGATLGLSVLAGPSAAIQPIQRTGKPVLKLSLAAYSMRKFLPNTRKDPNAKGEMGMLEFVDYGAKLGLDAVELTSYFFPSPLSRDYINQIKHRAHVNGLDISGGAIGNKFTYHPDSAVLQEQMVYTKLWIDHYAAMGAPVIRVFAGRPANEDDPGKRREAIRNIIQNLRTACDYAAKKGVILAMENHDFTTDLDIFLEIMKAVDSPWFGGNFDSGNVKKTADPYRDLARIAPYSLNAQVKVEIPVNGVKQPADLRRIVDILRQADYSGYVTLEYEAKEDPYQAIPRYLDELRRYLG
jgi:sugar phosphate isomerase/epimerase